MEKVRERVYLAKMPKPRRNARTYVAHGDNVWGNSITTHTMGDDHEVRVTGWLARAPFPQEGDVLLLHMQSGLWAKWVFTEVKRHRDPNDMFSGRARGAVGVADQTPTSKRCDEFITDASPYFR